MATTKKVATLKDLTEKVKKAKLMVLTDYQGLAHKQLEDLRKILKKVDAEFTVTKNSLFKKALNEEKVKISDEHLNSATGTVFAYGDEATPVKELVNFLKAANVGKIKAGMLGNQELSTADINRLAKLPSREIVLAQLLGQLNAPVSALHNALSWNLRKLVWSLDAVKSKKS